MDPSKRVVIEIPVKEIWDQDGAIKATRDRNLSADDLKTMLKKFPVEFVITNVRGPLKTIPVDKCFELWNPKKRLNVCMAMTAPGTASLCGTISRKNILWLSQGQRLSSERSDRS
jgi:hypothetical protein